MNKNVRIAKQLLKIAKSLIASDFNFVTTKECGPENILVVAKSDVFAHQITSEDVEKIENMSAREGDYDESYKAEGNWICTAKVGEDAGEFWIVKDAKFGKNYEKTVMDNETLTKKVPDACNAEFEFKHYPAAGNATFECFRLPADAPKQMTFGGQKFVPGDYVFIEKGECDIWARSASFMQQQYHLVEKGGKASQKIKDQYEQIISGKED